MRSLFMGSRILTWLFPLASVFLPLHLQAQVSSDGTLSTTVSTPDGVNFAIDGGNQAGGNLFHSFREFSVPQGGSAAFNQGSNVQNIIARVTGGSASLIHGLISTNGTANLFLINPNGIVMGADARLNLGGSFLGTTAQSLNFADGTEFSATNLAGTPLLTVTAPVGLQFGSDPGAIQVRGPGSNLDLLPPSFLETDRRNRPVGLQVASGKTLALVGGDVFLEGGNLTASEGRVELGSVGSGQVGLTPIALGWSLDYSNVPVFRDIRLTQAASIDVSGAGGGDIQVQGRRLSLFDGSAILSDTLGSRSGGNVLIRAADSIVLDGISPTFFSTGLYANVGTGATGSGSNVTIATQNLRATRTAYVTTSPYGAGNAGRLTVRAATIELVTVPGDLFPAVFTTRVFPRAMGNGNDLVIEAAKLTLTGGSQISTGTGGRGNSGDLLVRVREIDISGTDDSGLSFSGLYTQNDSRAGGNAGNIVIDSQRLRLADRALISAAVFNDAVPGAAGQITLSTSYLRVEGGAQITTVARGRANAGDMVITADTIEILGSNLIRTRQGVTRFPSALVTSTASTATGSGGNMRVQTGNLQILNGGSIQTSTLGPGKAGNLTLIANTIDIAGVTPDGSGSRIEVGGSPNSSGDGGTVQIQTGTLSVRDRGFIFAGNQGLGAAGNLEIQADSILLDQGRLVAQVRSGDRGNISIQAGDIIGLWGSQIFASALNQATGGNITIDADLIALFSSSDIVAQAVQGQGGNIQITTEGFIAGQGSQIDASSQLGIDGAVTINTPETDLVQQVGTLPETVVDPTQLIARSCLVSSDFQQGKFIITGAGGLPNLPGSAFQSPLETYTVSLPVTQPTGKPAAQVPDEMIVEAEGFYQLEDGQWVLGRECQSRLNQPPPIRQVNSQTVPWGEWG